MISRDRDTGTPRTPRLSVSLFAATYMTLRPQYDMGLGTMYVGSSSPSTHRGLALLGVRWVFLVWRIHRNSEARPQDARAAV
jgi:hypothetical protein